MKKLMLIMAITTIAVAYGDEKSMYGTEAGPARYRNLYEETIRRQQQESYQEEQLELQRQQLKELKRQNGNGFGRYNNPYSW